MAHLCSVFLVDGSTNNLVVIRMMLTINTLAVMDQLLHLVYTRKFIMAQLLHFLYYIYICYHGSVTTLGVLHVHLLSWASYYTLRIHVSLSSWASYYTWRITCKFVIMGQLQHMAFYM